MTPAVARKTIGYISLSRSFGNVEVSSSKTLLLSPYLSFVYSSYQVVATGGRIIAHAQFLPMLRSALLERDANWKVSKTDTPMDDVINGVSRLRFVSALN